MYHLLSQCLERGKFRFHGTMAFENTQNKCETHIEKRHILVQVNTSTHNSGNAVRKDIRHARITSGFVCLLVDSARCPTLNKHNHCSPQRHTILPLASSVVFVAEVRKDIRPQETFTIKTHQILRLSHKKTHILSPHHI